MLIPAHKPNRAGLTLVELLVVIAIVVMVTAASIPLLAPATDARRQREASRIASSFFASAQNRAVATGRPTGVWLQRDANSVYSCSTLFMCEAPPPYMGDVANATMQVTRENPGSPFPTNADFLYFSAHPSMGSFSPGIIQIGDRIQFGNQGHLYEVIGPDPDLNGYVDSGPIRLRLPKRFKSANPNLPPPDDTLPNPNYESNTLGHAQYRAYTYLPWPASGLSNPVAFKVLRQPQKSSVSGVQLPEGSTIDLRWSGPGDAIGSDPVVWPNRGTLVVLFSPQGNLQDVFTVGATGVNYAPVASVHFLVGKSELLFTGNNSALPTTLPTDPEEYMNFQDTENFWVTVQRGNGLATTAQLAKVDLTPPAFPPYSLLNQYSIWVNSTRRFAQQSRTVGGQ